MRQYGISFAVVIMILGMFTGHCSRYDERLETEAWEVPVSPADLGYNVVPDWLKLPGSMALGGVSGVAVDSEDHIFIVQRGEAAPPVLCFDMNGRFLFSWNGPMMMRSGKVNVDSRDHVWLTDEGGHCVYELDNRGNVILVLGEKGMPGTDGSHFDSPADVTLNAEGHIFVADGSASGRNRRIVRFDEQGRFMMTWGREGTGPYEFSGLSAVLVNAGGTVLVSDLPTWRVQSFDAYGRLETMWDHIGSVDDMVEDEKGNYYALDGHLGRITKINRKGRIVGFFGGAGDGTGQLSRACCIARLSGGDIVVGHLDGRVQYFSRSAPAQKAEIGAGNALRKIAGGFQFTEGVASDRDGNIYFSDIPASKIYRCSPDGRCELFMQDSRNANGLIVDDKGNVILCESINGGALVAVTPNGGIEVLAEGYRGIPFNSLNDLWMDPRGGIYLTDPRYGPTSNQLNQDGEHVYYLTPDRTRIIRVIGDMTGPNGITGTPDGKTLYVSDQKAGKTYQYDINRDGTLGNRRIFADEGSDGMTLDNKGNVYLTNRNVRVYTAEGELADVIEVPEQTTNVCFGGRNKRTLFITAQTSVYAIRMQVKGVYSN